jgi:hypothetical protein
MGLELTPARARALEAAGRGELHRYSGPAELAADGKTYAAGLGTVQKGTIEALRGAEPPLLTEGEPAGRYVPLVLTAAGRAALAEHNSAIRYVGKGRR